jgi:hypothetical protein
MPANVSAQDRPSTFNTVEKSVTKNGNLQVAISKITSLSPEALWRAASFLPIEQITKNPYSSMGRLCKISGVVDEIQEMPPDKIMSGRCSDILIMVKNRNASLGMSGIEIFYAGDPRDINPETTITFAGYYIGTIQTHNLMGGIVENLVFVTNSIKVTPRRNNWR